LVIVEAAIKLFNFLEWKLLAYYGKGVSEAAILWFLSLIFVLLTNKDSVLIHCTQADV
jgi:hypothetical protein